MNEETNVIDDPLIPRNLPDVQKSNPSLRLPLSRVGMSGIKKKIPFDYKGNVEDFEVVLNTYVDLPNSNRGIHMSRNLEAINFLVHKIVNDRPLSLIGFAMKLANEIINVQDNATRSIVELETDVFFDQFSPSTNKRVQTHANVLICVEAKRSSKKSTNLLYRVSMRTRAQGMTVCPCSFEMTKAHVFELLIDKGISKDKAKELLDVLPLSAHNQRSIGEITLIIEGGEEVEDLMPECDEVAKIIFNSMSSPIYELLKRPDEHVLVINAHKNPLFVEDVVRNMLKGIYDAYYDLLPLSTEIRVRQKNYESIHPYNAVAEEYTTLEGLIKFFEENNH